MEEKERGNGSFTTTSGEFIAPLQSKKDELFASPFLFSKIPTSWFVMARAIWGERHTSMAFVGVGCSFNMNNRPSSIY